MQVYGIVSSSAEAMPLMFSLLSISSHPQCPSLQAYGIVSSSAKATPLMFGLLFGFAGGMMVAVVFMEILPNAYLFDPRNIWVGRGVALGFAIMAASLLLFGVKG